MKKIILFFIIFCYSFITNANEVLSTRFAVQSDKTRIVFDLKEKPNYRIDVSYPYQVIVDFDDIDLSAKLPIIPKQNYGQIIDTIKVQKESNKIRYVFNLKYNVRPFYADLKPSGNYKYYRLYLDFINNKIEGDLNKKKLPEHLLLKKEEKVESNPQKQNTINIKKDEPDGVKVLTPAEAEAQKLAIQKANQEKMRQLELEKKKQSNKNSQTADNKIDKKNNTASNSQLNKPNSNTINTQSTNQNLNNANNNKNNNIEKDKNQNIKEQKTIAEKKEILPKNDKKQNCKKTKKIVIAIDAGHGGKDPGAIGPNGVKEKTITMGIARHLSALINKNSKMKGILTRGGDYFVELDNRSEIARKNNADILISIHADAAENEQAKGASVLVLNNDRAGRENKKMLNSKNKHDNLLGGASEVLEETAKNGENDNYMQNMIIDLTSGKSRDAGYDLANQIINKISVFAPVHKNKPDERSLAVLKAPDIPSILVETGFVSNKDEEQKLKTSNYQRKVAQAIYDALLIHLANPKYQISNVDQCLDGKK